MMRKAGHVFSDGDPMQDSINELALRAAKDERVREELIQNQTQTILRTAGAVCHQHIDRNDDEWSVSLCAFSRAIDLYRAERGDFLPFAQMLIKRSLIDHYRAERDKLHEIPVAPYILEGGGEPEALPAPTENLMPETKEQQEPRPDEAERYEGPITIEGRPADPEGEQRPDMRPAEQELPMSPLEPDGDVSALPE